MKHFVGYVESGRPVIGIRCSLLAFTYEEDSDSAYAHFHVSHPEGGFGGRVLGETWRDHHGHHMHESTRGLINGLHRGHPILEGVSGDIWGPSDVYRIDDLPRDAKVLAFGMALQGMQPDDAPNYSKPIMPMLWTRNYQGSSGKTARVVTSTMGASRDLENEDLRRLVVNSVYWVLHLEAEIPERSNVDFVGEFTATPIGHDKFHKGQRPADLIINDDN